MNNKALINSFVWPGLQQRPHLSFASLMAVEPLSFSSSETNYKKNIEGAVYGLFRKIIRT